MKNIFKDPNILDVEESLKSKPAKTPKQVKKEKVEQSKLIDAVVDLLRDHAFVPGQLNIFGRELENLLADYELYREQAEEQRFAEAQDGWKQESQQITSVRLKRE